MPAMPINKGIATASLLSQLITSKYQYGVLGIFPSKVT